MELLILCLWYAIIRGVGQTARNVSDLLHGRPVQVHRPAAYANGYGGGLAPMGPMASPSYSGRAIGTVAAVTKESLTAGLASGWQKGQARHAARVERREVKRAAKAARKAGLAPELDTHPAADEQQPTGPAGGIQPGVMGEAPRWPGVQQEGQPLWDVPVGAGEWVCRNCGEGNDRHCRACRVCVDRATHHLGECPEVLARIKAEQAWEAQRAAEAKKAQGDAEQRRARQAAQMAELDEELAQAEATGQPTYIHTPFDPEQAEQKRNELLAAGRCTQVVLGKYLCGFRVVPGLQVCAQHKAAAEQTASAADMATTETSDASETAEDGEAPRLYMIRGELDDKATDSGDEPQFEAVPEQPAQDQTVPEQPAQDESVPAPEVGRAMLEGAPSMTATTTGETTNIGATRAYFSSLAEYTGTDILGQLELANATLQQAEMDSETLGHLAAAVEHFGAAKTALEQALATLNSKHALMEEAVKGTPDAAKRDYYKE